MHGPYWTVAIDTALCNRLTHCTGCGHPFTAAWFDLWTRSDGLCLAMAACPRCKRADPRGATITTIMDTRYGA
jgi:hypothetical protein